MREGIDMSRTRRLAAAVAVAVIITRKRRVIKKRIWVRNWIARRATLGAYAQLLQELRNEDPKQFKIFLRMSEEDFNLLLTFIHDIIIKVDTNMRESIKPQERLAVTLRFLASGKFIVYIIYIIN